MSSTFVGLGSNIGARARSLAAALERLERLGPVVRRISSVYETAPVGPVHPQPLYYNAVAELSSTLAPPALLERLLEVERDLGRQRLVAKGPRVIDLDLLLAGPLVARWPGLDLPHPELGRRAFVLRPLLELDPGLCDPRDGVPLARKLAALPAGGIFHVGDLHALARRERDCGLARHAG